MTVVDIAISPLAISFFFFFNDTATTEIYTLSLHDALPIYRHAARESRSGRRAVHRPGIRPHRGSGPPGAGLRGPPLHHDHVAVGRHRAPGGGGNGPGTRFPPDRARPPPAPPARRRTPRHPRRPHRPG